MEWTRTWLNRKETGVGSRIGIAPWKRDWDESCKIYVARVFQGFQKLGFATYCHFGRFQGLRCFTWVFPGFHNFLLPFVLPGLILFCSRDGHQPKRMGSTERSDSRRTRTRTRSSRSRRSHRHHPVESNYHQPQAIFLPHELMVYRGACSFGNLEPPFNVQKAWPVGNDLKTWRNWKYKGSMVNSDASGEAFFGGIQMSKEGGWAMWPCGNILAFSWRIQKRLVSRCLNFYCSVNCRNLF